MVGPGPRHDEVEARLNRGDAVAERAPVGDANTLEAPVASQLAGDEVAVLGAIHAVEQVVGGHDGPGSRLANGFLESAQVDLVEGAFVDDRIGHHARDLLAVAREVLEAGADSAALYSLDHPRRHGRGEKRILAEVLEPASAERASLDVHPGPKTTATSWRTHSSPMARPTSSAISTSKEQASVLAVGKHVAGTDSCNPRWSVRPSCLRSPCGPSLKSSGDSAAWQRLREPMARACEERSLLLGCEGG